jgi:speckle-type POZ protein
MANVSASSMGATSEDEPSLTASAIVAPDVKCGSHILRIDGYSRTKGIGNGKFIASEAFVVGGHRWRLLYYPNSPLLSDSDWIYIYLYIDDTTADEVKASFTISLLDHDGNVVPSYSKSCPMYSFSNSHGAKRLGRALITRSDLEGSDYLKDDVFSVRCDVTVSKEVFTKAFPVSEVRRG